MRTRHLPPAALLVIIPLVLAAVVWVFFWVTQLLFPLINPVTVVIKNGIGSWIFPTTDEHCITKAYKTQQTTDTHPIMTPPVNPVTATPFLLDYYYRHTTCFILGMVLLVPLAICISILVSRSYGKIPIDLIHIYTSWNQQKSYDSSLVAPSTPLTPTSGEAVIVSSPPSPTPSPLPSSIINAQDHHYSVHSPVIEITTETTHDAHNLSTNPTPYNTEVHLLSHPESNKDHDHHLTTATLIDKRKKKRPKQSKKKERGKRDLILEQTEKEAVSPVKQQKQPQPQQQRSQENSAQSPSSPKVSKKASLSINDRAPVNHQQPMIIVPPAPPPHSPRSVNLIGTVAPGTPVVTQKTPIKLATQPVTNKNRTPPSPAVSPKDSPSAPLSTTALKKTSTTVSSPLPQQPMVTKLISNKKDHLPTSAPLTPSIPKPNPKPSTPLSISSASIVNSGPAIQSWYSPFNTGLEFDLLSRSPPSPANTSSTSSSVNQTDYRLFSDSPRIPSSNTSSGYTYLQQQPNQPTHQSLHHQLHQQPHSLSNYQYRHNTHPSQPPQHHLGHSSTYDYLIYGSLPKTSIAPMRISPPPSYIESSSSIADLPPPTPPPSELMATTRLPTPPVSLSPVIAPPTLPSVGSTGKTPSTFPFSMWYPWKPRPTTDPDEEGQHYKEEEEQQQQQLSSSFSLFDRKLSFHSPPSDA